MLINYCEDLLFDFLVGFSAIEVIRKNCYTIFGDISTNVRVLVLGNLLLVIMVTCMTGPQVNEQLTYLMPKYFCVTKYKMFSFYKTSILFILNLFKPNNFFFNLTFGLCFVTVVSLTKEEELFKYGY